MSFFSSILQNNLKYSQLQSVKTLIVNFLFGEYIVFIEELSIFWIFYFKNYRMAETWKMF